MKLTWLIKTEDPSFLLLSLDETPWKEVQKSLFLPHLNVFRGANSLQEFEERFSRLEVKLCKAAALRLLSIKGRFSQELRQKLRLKLFSEKAIEFALHECERFGYLNDIQAAEGLVRKLQRRGYGSRIIGAKLKASGAGGFQQGNEDPKPFILQLMEKKYRQIPREKAIQALLRRGFEYRSILDALNSFETYKG
jgi:regulatory protein